MTIWDLELVRSKKESLEGRGEQRVDCEGGWDGRDEQKVSLVPLLRRWIKSHLKLLLPLIFSYMSANKFPLLYKPLWVGFSMATTRSPSWWYCYHILVLANVPENMFSALHIWSLNSKILRQVLWPPFCRWVNQETEMLSGWEIDTQTYSWLFLHKFCASGEPCQAVSWNYISIWAACTWAGRAKSRIISSIS